DSEWLIPGSASALNGVESDYASARACAGSRLRRRVEVDAALFVELLRGVQVQGVLRDAAALAFAGDVAQRAVVPGIGDAKQECAVAADENVFGGVAHRSGRAQTRCVGQELILEISVAVIAIAGDIGRGVIARRQLRAFGWLTIHYDHFGRKQKSAESKAVVET